MYGIAGNVLAQSRRTRWQTGRLELALPPALAEMCHADQVSARVSAEATRRLLQRALAELNRGDREVLLLIAWEELSYDEVAVALNVPIGTVRSRLHRARAHMRSALGDRNPLHTDDLETAELTNNG